MSQHLAAPLDEPAAEPGAAASAAPVSSTGAVDRLLALSGAAFVVAILAGNSLTETVAQDDTPAGSAAELATGVGDAAVSAGLALEVVGLLCLAVFGSVVTARTAGRARVRPVPGLVTVAATLLVAVKLASAAPFLAARSAVDDLPDEVLHALVETNGAAFVLCWIPMALFVGAAAVALRDARLTGRVTTYVGVLLAVTGLALGVMGVLDPPAANPLAFLASLLWVAVVSVRLALRRAEA